MGKTRETDEKRIRLMVMAGLMAALTCIATMIIRIPTLKGYIHLGDAMVIASGILLGGVFGPLAGGIGSMLADILGGYYYFAVATLVIKTLSGFAASTVYKVLGGHEKKVNTIVKVLLAGLAAEIIMVIGYFGFEIFYEGTAAAIAEIIPNTVQGVSGIIIATVLIPALVRNPEIKNKVTQ